VWAAPSILTLDAAAAASCGTGGSVDWSTIATAPTFPFTTTSNTVVTTVSRGAVPASAGTDAYTVGPPQTALGTSAPTFGGFGAANTYKYLFLRMVNAPNNATMSVTFTFSKSVNNLTFTFLDIDGANNQTWRDRVVVSAPPNTAPFGATKPGGGNNPAGTGTAANPLLGNGSVGDTTDNGNATIKFNNPVSSVTITYSAAKAATTDQYIGITNLSWNGCT